MGFVEDIQKNPTFFGAVIVAVIAIIIAAYGQFKTPKSKMITYSGVALMIGALLVAAISHFYVPPAPVNGNGTTSRTACPPGAGTGGGYPE